MSDFHLKTPVAFIIFNRPDTTKRVFAEIAKARPPKLLVIADGLRADHPNYMEMCADECGVTGVALMEEYNIYI